MIFKSFKIAWRDIKGEFIIESVSTANSASKEEKKKASELLISNY